ncbi:MAG TPA: FtsX-like permease family protein, partial [Terriglobales bacterium]|nr:FtsX-like permease family protein [Terriglobales bacterium]
LQALPGIQSAAFSRMTPFSYGVYSSAPVTTDAYITAPGEQPIIEYNEISPGYLSTMGIPLVSGREFAPADKEPALPVAIVNDVMAAQFWHGHDPVGSRMQVKGKWLQIVGVAKVSKYRTLIETPQPFFYVPIRQSLVGGTLYIRTSLPPSALATALMREVHSIDPNLAAGEIITMQEEIDRSTAVQHIAVNMLGVFGGLALLLAGVGLYGVMSYAVSQSTREFGLRMALGARASNLLRLVLSQGLLLTMAGVLLGGLAALGLSRLLGYLLYRVSPHDPMTFATAMLVMFAASAGACFVPAWRATRINPITALRD